MKEIIEEKQWVLCPGCKRESIIGAKHFIIEIRQPDAKTQC